jgi:predicted dehydrogenase
MKKIKLGFVGAGFNGQIGHLESFRKIKNCEFVALAEDRDKLRSLIKKKYKFKKAYKNHHELLKKEKEIDGVIIVTKRNMTAPIAYDCIKKNLNVFTEKPMASTYMQTKKLVNLSTAKKVLYKIGYNKIFDPVVWKAKNLFHNQKITKDLGRIIMVKSHRLSGTGYPKKPNYIETNEKNTKSEPSWPSAPSWMEKKYFKDYEKYLNLYSHNINMIRFFLGDQLTVKSANLNDDYISSVLLNYKKSIPVLLTTGFFTKEGWDDYLQIFYEKGYLKINFPPQHIAGKYTNFLFHRVNAGKKNIIHKSNKTWSFDLQAKSFIKDLESNKITYNEGSDILKDMLLIENIWKKFIYEQTR